MVNYLRNSFGLLKKKKKNAKKAIKVILTLDNFINRTLLSHYKGSLMAVTEC